MSDDEASTKKAPDPAVLESHLCNAARAQDVKTLKRWLRRATRLRNRCLNTTAIHRAAANGNEEIVDILIRFGCNLEHKWNGHAPLSTAVWNSREGATELLARTKIAIDGPDPAVQQVNSPLHLAAQHSFHAGMRSLLKAGASVNIRNRIEATPLHLAASKGDLLGVKLLLEHDATTSFRDKDGQSALQLAATRGFDKVVRVLLDYGAEIDDYDASRDPETGVTALLSAVRSNKLAVVRTLLQQGANVNLQIKAKGRLVPSPLHFAAGNGFVEVAKVLLEYKADLESWNGRKETPLLSAGRYSKTETLEQLLEAGADIEAKVGPFNTLLTKTVSAKNFGLAQLLIDKGARLEIRGTKKETLLHHAAAQDDTEGVDFLLKNHSDAGAQDIKGMTPLMLAAECDGVTSMGILLAYGAPIDTQDRMGQTALHFAAGSGSTEATSLLLDSGAEPVIMSKQNLYAHGVARQYGHKAVEDIILEALENTGRLIHDPRWPETPLALPLTALENGYEIQNYGGRPFIHILPEPRVREDSKSPFDNGSAMQYDDLSRQRRPMEAHDQPEMRELIPSTTEESIQQPHGDSSEPPKLASLTLTDVHRPKASNSSAQSSTRESGRSSLDSTRAVCGSPTSSHPSYWDAE